jgi:cytidine deaminase
MIMTKLTKEEQGFIERVKPLLKEFLALCKRKGIELGAGSYVLSEKGNVYHGVPFSVAREIHGEENAIGAMVTEEGTKAKLKIVLIIGGPEEIVMPCGMCRVAIERYSVKNATVLCANLSLSKIEKFTISELYPYPYKG